MTANVNPYKFMLLKFQPSRIYGWEREIASILQVITSPEPVSYAIYGIRAIGKSTLLKFLKDPHGATKRYSQYMDDRYRTKRRELIWVYVNFHQMFQNDHVLYIMYEHLVEELQIEGYESRVSLELPDRDEEGRDIAVKLKELLQKIDDEYQTRVVFLMDDFDIPLLSNAITQDDDYLLRSVSDAAALLIATDEPISSLRPDITKASPLLGILRPERIGLINEEAATKLICQPARDVKVHFIQEEVDMLMSVGGRIPYLLTLTCEKYFDMRAGIVDDIEAVFKNPALRHSQQSIRSQLIELLLLEPGVNNVLTLIWTKREELHAPLIEMAKNEDQPVSGKDAAKVEMYSLAYVRVGQHGTGYVIFSALFAEFVRRQANIQAVPNGKYDAALAPVINGLSPVDRGVLEYLATREGKVCTFDELLEAVWEDGTGTKRALEAAVHRLRRTVPSGHKIKNIRGSGYKYVIADEARV